MKWLNDMFKESPVWPRVLPFMIFVALIGLKEVFGEAGRYWVYFGRTLVGAWLVWLMRPFVEEMRWAWSWEALAAGVLVFVIWVGLDPFYPKLGGGGEPWNPFACFGEATALGWFFFLVRLLGSSLVVPPLEEVFYRSFVYRFVAKADFLAVPLNHVAWTPLLVTAGLFGLTHYQWLAGILCGLIYQGLVLRKNRLGDAMTAHAITNCLLGLWVLARQAWHFW